MRMVQEEIALLREENFFPGSCVLWAPRSASSMPWCRNVSIAGASACGHLRTGRKETFAPVFEYDLKGTVCERVFRTGEAQYFPRMSRIGSPKRKHSLP